MQPTGILWKLIHSLRARGILHGGIRVMIVNSHLGVVCGVVGEEFTEVAQSSCCEVVPT